MQRDVDDGVMISCDFCGTDWDEVIPMIEGHKGSVLCLGCLRHAMDDMSPRDELEDARPCTLCLQTPDADVPVWAHPGPKNSPGLNGEALACRSCLRQAAKGFHKDFDIDYTWDELARREAMRKRRS